MEVICQKCNKKFNVKPSAIARGSGKFCSKHCFNEARKVRELTKCNFCGKEFLVRSRYLRLGRAKHCSKACSGKTSTKNGTVELICENCNQKFFSKKGQAKVGRKFCSQSCLNFFNEKRRKEVKCLTCNKVIERTPHDKKENNFCSLECSWEFKKKGKLVKCKVCEKEIWKRPSVLKVNKFIFCSKVCHFIFYRGENSPVWKGGVTPEDKKIRKSDEYKKWRLDVFKRDNWTCQFCGEKSKKGNIIKIEAHHIKSFKNYPELRFDINNGLTLCSECHKKTDNYGTKNKNSTEL